MKQFIYLLVVLTLTACSGPASINSCAAGHPAVQTQLYFGLNKASGGTVSAKEWQDFVRGEIAPRFPEGFTIVDGRGFWLGEASKHLEAENSKVVVRIHDRTASADKAIEDIIADYKREFAQESVLRVDAPVCAGF